MRTTLFTSALALAVASVVTASSLPSYEVCVTQKQATHIVNELISVLQHAPGANATAQRIIADSFQEYSDSILSLEGAPLGGATADSKAEWINGVLGFAPDNNVTTFLAAPAGCNHIIWFWQFNAIARAIYPVKGFNLLTLNNNLQITRLDVEFNSIAWGLDDSQLPCNFTAKL